MKLEPLILASSSPRRTEILQTVGWSFEKLVVEIDESHRENETPEQYVERLAVEKASAVASKIDSGLILGADTTVVADSKILGKPNDEQDAFEMLKMLSGCWHEVLTGVALVRVGENTKSISAIERTSVKFAQMTEEEIACYIASKEPMDKAGAYAIQGRAAIFIEEIEGDYWNIVGLPIRLVYELSKNV
jgi:septum formation protein